MGTFAILAQKVDTHGFFFAFFLSHFSRSCLSFNFHCFVFHSKFSLKKCKQTIFALRHKHRYFLPLDIQSKKLLKRSERWVNKQSNQESFEDKHGSGRSSVLTKIAKNLGEKTNTYVETRQGRFQSSFSKSNWLVLAQLSGDL